MGTRKIDRTRKGWKSNCRIVKHGKWVCWEWKYGYGGDKRPIISGEGYRAKPEHAARYAIRLLTGKIDHNAIHKCDNQRCVRPGHLIDGTHSRNMSDAWARHPRANIRRKEQSERMVKNRKSKKLSAGVVAAARRRMRKLWKTPEWRTKMVASQIAFRKRMGHRIPTKKRAA